MLYDAKKRAKKKGLPFNLTHADLVIPNVCPLLGIPLNHARGDNMPSVDRLKPDLGYIKGNVWIVSYRANRIKNNATLEELEMIARNWRLHWTF